MNKELEKSIVNAAYNSIVLDVNEIKKEVLISELMPNIIEYLDEITEWANIMRELKESD